MVVGQMRIKVREIRKREKMLKYQQIRSGWGTVERMEKGQGEGG